MCLRGWEQCEALELLDTDTISVSEVEDNAYEILAMGGDVDELTDEEFDECVSILKTLTR
jgi:hypothetical protein